MARELEITGENYVWVVTQSVMENLQAAQLFPVGMLGKYKNVINKLYSSLFQFNRRTFFTPKSCVCFQVNNYHYTDKY